MERKNLINVNAVVLAGVITGAPLLAFAQSSAPAGSSPHIRVMLAAGPCKPGESCIDVKGAVGTSLHWDPVPAVAAPPAPAPIVVQVPTSAPAPAAAACTNCGGHGAKPASDSGGWCGAGWCTWLKWAAGLAAALGLFLYWRSQRMALAMRRGKAAAARELFLRYNAVNPNAPETLRALERWHQEDGEMRQLVWWRRLRMEDTNTLPTPTYTPNPAPPPPAPPAAP